MAKEHDLSKYTAVDTPAEEQEVEGVLLVGLRGELSSVIRKAEEILAPEGGRRHIILKGTGGGVSRAVVVAETVRRNLGGLHQCAKITQADVVKKYELKEGQEGEKTIEVAKFRSGVEICLSRDPLDASAPGYQEPIPAEDRPAKAPSARPDSAGAGQRKQAGGGGRGGGGRGGGGGGANAKGGRGRGRGGGGKGSGAGGRGSGRAVAR